MTLGNMRANGVRSLAAHGRQASRLSSRPRKLDYSSVASTSASWRFSSSMERVSVSRERFSASRRRTTLKHDAIISAAPWRDDVPVQTFGPRMACMKCGIIGADARPNWREHRA
jgi:hypothetical protein